MSGSSRSLYCYLFCFWTVRIYPLVANAVILGRVYARTVKDEISIHSFCITSVCRRPTDDGGERVAGWLAGRWSVGVNEVSITGVDSVVESQVEPKKKIFEEPIGILLFLVSKTFSMHSFDLIKWRKSLRM